jgi:hypothetical protein
LDSRFRFFVVVKHEWARCARGSVPASLRINEPETAGECFD